MSIGIYEATEREVRICKALRQKAVAEIRRRKNAAEVATVLGLAPSGLESLLWQKDWPLELCFRVTEALGIESAAEIERVVALETTSVSSTPSSEK